MPTPHHYRYRQTVKALNEYVGNLIRDRWAKHQSGAKIEKEDILDRVLKSLVGLFLSRALSLSRPPPLASSMNRRPRQLQSLLSFGLIGANPCFPFRLVLGVLGGGSVIVQDPKEWGEHMVRQLTDEIKTFLLAGHETSASMLTWSLLELCKNPHILEKVKAEGKGIFTDGARGKGEDVYGSSKMPPQESLKALTYTVNTLKESLRLYTLVPMVVRICSEDDEIDGQAIPAGSKIFMLLKVRSGWYGYGGTVGLVRLC